MLAREAAPIWRENVVAVVILLRVYQMFEVLAFCNRVKAQPPSITITVLTFLVKKSTMKNSVVSIFWQYAKKRVVFLVLEAKVSITTALTATFFLTDLWIQQLPDVKEDSHCTGAVYKHGKQIVSFFSEKYYKFRFNDGLCTNSVLFN